MAEKIRGGFPEKASGEEKLKSLVFQLFEEMGFHGSTLDYDHRSNSYLNEVIDDREGLPSPFRFFLSSWPTDWTFR